MQAAGWARAASVPAGPATAWALATARAVAGTERAVAERILLVIEPGRVMLAGQHSAAAHRSLARQAPRPRDHHYRQAVPDPDRFPAPTAAAAGQGATAGPPRSGRFRLRPQRSPSRAPQAARPGVPAHQAWSPPGLRSRSTGLPLGHPLMAIGRGWVSAAVWAAGPASGWWWVSAAGWQWAWADHPPAPRRRA